ncbi:MAG: peptide chain release factor N(5)-glutamine methyltransferase [Bacteroidota bacterium]
MISPSIQAFYNDIVLKLKALYPNEEARAMADRLFEFFFDLSPAQRIIAGSAMAIEANRQLIDAAVVSLLKQVPLQYVLGKADFMDMEFVVNPSVLIPRPETEELVSLILKDISIHKPEMELQVLDIGTGSGCIAISLKRFLPVSIVTAVDISEEAITVAGLNALKNKADIRFIQADILDENLWEMFPPYDLIVSNPPYVTLAEKQFIQHNVLDYEPHTALFVPDTDPLLFYRNIIAFATKKLQNGGSLWFEINEQFGNELKFMALEQGFEEVNIIFDFRGKSRFLQCSKMKKLK